MAKSPFSTIVELAQPAPRLSKVNALLGAVLGVSHVFWIGLFVLLVDLLLWDGRVSFDDPAVRVYVSDLTGNVVPPGSPPLLNAGVVPSVVHARGQWSETFFQTVYHRLPWTRRTESYLVGLLILALLLGLLRWGIVFLQRSTIASAAADSMPRLQREVFLRSFSQDLAAGTGPSLSEMLRNAIPTLERGLQARMELFPREPIRIVALIAAASALNIWLGATFVLLAALAWLVGSIAIREAVLRLRRYSQAHSEALERLSDLAEKTRLIKSFAADEYFRGIYEDRLKSSRHIDQRRMGFEAAFVPIWGAAGLAAALALVGMASQNILANRLGLAGAAGVLAAFLGIAWSFLEFYWRRRVLAEGDEAARRIQSHLAQTQRKATFDGDQFLPAIKEAIEFVDVYVRDSNGRWLLHGFNARLDANRRTALLAIDPAALRTVVDLLNRFLDPERGGVAFDGRDARRATLESLHAQVCLVLKDELLFPDTVAHNIGCGDPGFSRERIVEAAKAAHAHQFIERLPNGYDCVVGDDARPLSIGERYRIGLARAILRDPPVVVIEEPSEPLDGDSAELIDDTLRHFLTRRTSLLIPTRWSTLRVAERVLILDRGRVVAAGPHDQLFAEAPIYRYLLSTRFPDLPRTLR